MNLTTMHGVIAYLGACATTQEYDRRCLEVKAANGGQYPLFFEQATEDAAVNFVNIQAAGMAGDGPGTDPNQADFFL